MSENIYDTEEYIAKVMRIENCSRKSALKLIRDFKRIDRTKSDVKKSLNDSDKLRAYRQSWKDRGLCICCGTEDENTRNGYTRCKRCADYQKAYYQKHKERLAEQRRIKRGTERQDS